MDLKLVLEKHGKWLRGEEGGERANLCCANLRDANLYGASLYHADLRGANLCDALNVDAANWDIYTAFYPLQCPGTGAFIGYKKPRAKLSCWRIVRTRSVAVLHHANAGAARRKC